MESTVPDWWKLFPLEANTGQGGNLMHDKVSSSFKNEVGHVVSQESVYFT
jgi:hypothetical protein